MRIEQSQIPTQIARHYGRNGSFDQIESCTFYTEADIPTCEVEFADDYDIWIWAEGENNKYRWKLESEHVLIEESIDSET